jgi:protein-disulfide isomerase
MDAQIKSLMSAVSTLIAVQIFSLVALAGGGFYLFSDLKRQVAAIAASGGRPPVPENVEEWERLTKAHNASQGAEDAKVVVVEFSDFQCPYCKKYTDETRRDLLARYGDEVRMVFKHLPIEQAHPMAMGAAIAAQCAQREGKFWEAHERFFAQPDNLAKDALISAGESLGLSRSYADCVTNEETRHEVERDAADAHEVGIQGTPTFVINGKVLVGAQPAASFRAAIDAARSSAD